ncbi:MULTISPECIES: S41 family peptidase [Niastella]|uniref:Tail specific protease domain-containing protein n=1 Tax=Niastella soli TaxID=2821487 RepID=A0ABS3Z2M6_9BACT|nr:S41 family peptidase [Niastella soli]MBO9204380.1 hypothetical protein [Niastella soli]
MIFILVLLSGLRVNAFSQGRKDSLQNDFNLLRNKLQHDYPSLYRYTSKATMTALFDSCYATLQDTTSKLAFFKTLKFLVSQIRDGHLSCSPSRELRQYLAAQKAYFPFRVRFIGNKAYIYKGADSSLSPGTEILTINNTPINQIKNTLFQYIVADGHIETKKNYILGNYFYIYYFLAFGGNTHFDISYKTANGSVSTQSMDAVLESALPPIEDDSKENNLLNLSITPDRIALLTIQTFDKATLEEAGLNFEDFLRTSFTTIKDQQIKKLVIDLRGNGGGRDLYGSLLYSYLSSSKFHYYKSLTTATSQLPFDQFKRGSTSFNDLNADLLTKNAAGTYQLKPAAHNNLQEMSPAVNNYTGQVWFLINGLSFSVTAEFCAIARSNKRGKFIGEETGGAYEGNTSGVQMDIVLPASQISVSYGTIQYNGAVRPVTPTGRGIIPDYRVLPTIDDLLNKRHIQLERTLELVRSGK